MRLSPQRVSSFVEKRPRFPEELVYVLVALIVVMLAVGVVMGMKMRDIQQEMTRVSAAVSPTHVLHVES